MEILERLRDLLTPEEDLPSTDRIREVREDAVERLEAAEAELEELRRSRADAVLEGEEAAEAHEAREEELEREIERLEAVRDRLGQKLDEALVREKMDRVGELAESLPGHCEGIEEAREKLTRHQQQVASAVGELAQLRVHLKRKAGEQVYLARSTIARIEKVEDEIPGHIRRSLENLTPPQGEPEGPAQRVIHEPRHGRRRFVGDWSQAELREAGFRRVRQAQTGEEMGDVLEGAS